MKTQAWYLKKYASADQAFEMGELILPELMPHEVSIEVESFGLNYADVMARNKLYREAPPLPAVLGYEVVGTVSQAGSQADQKLIGKRVVAFTRFGGYSQRVNTPAHAVVEIGELPANQALSLATQYVTAYYMSVYQYPLRKGEKILIHAAAGGVGIALVQLAKLAGAEVLAKVGSDEKVAYLKSVGVDHVINYKKQDYAEAAKKLLKGERFDAIYNPVAGSTFKTDMELLGSGGRLVLFGGSERLGKRWGIFSTLNFVRKMGLIIPIGLMMRSKSILGINMLKIADFKPEILQSCLQEVVALVKAGKLTPPEGTSFHQEQLADAHALLESGKSIGKISLNWN